MAIRLQFFIIFLIPLILFSQGKRDYIWLLGGNRQQTSDTSFQGFQIDFNTIPRSIYIKDRPFPIIRQNNSSICDREGNLMMYTAGCWISDRLFRPMPNGKINEGLVWDFSCNKGDYGGFNGSMFLPSTLDSNFYFLIHKFNEFDPDPKFPGSTDTKLLMSKVDLGANLGYGDVVIKNLPLLEKHLSGGDLTATRHANGQDWWIVSVSRVSNTYYAVHFSDTGLVRVVESTLGPPTGYIEDGGSQSCFSPNGRLFARMGPSTGLYLLDFDRNSGVFSNIRTAITGKENENFSTGACFSPNGRYLYVTSQLDLWQFDTQAPDLQSSMTHIDTWDGYVDDGIWAAQFGAMMPGPDCKIYMITRTSNLVMHLIHSPNEPGKACHFEQHGLRLPSRNHASIPNFPYYRLDHEAICDSTLVWIRDQASDTSLLQFWLHPNPASTQFILNLYDYIPERMEVQLINAQGTILRRVRIFQGSNVIDIKDLPAGVYSVLIYERGSLLKAEKLQVMGE